MKRFNWKGKTHYNPSDLKMGTLLLYKDSSFDDITFLVKTGRYYFSTIASDRISVDQLPIFKFSLINKVTNINVKVLDRSDLLLFMNMNIGREFEKLLKG